MKLRSAIIATVLVEVLIVFLSTLNHGWNIEGLQVTTRFSGRLSLLMFSFIFLLHPGNKAILENYFSKYYFLVFAIAHGIHLIELLSFVYLSGVDLVPYRLAGGFLAYGLIFLMPWLNARNENKKLSDARFNAFGQVYIFYVWFIFFMTYIGRLNGSFADNGVNPMEYRLLLGWVCAMLGIKLVRFYFNKSATP